VENEKIPVAEGELPVGTTRLPAKYPQKKLCNIT
jgi:hypothetical protein